VILSSIIISFAIFVGTLIFDFGLRKDDLKVIRVLVAGIPLFAGIKLIWGIFQGEKLSNNYTFTKQIFLPTVRLLLLTITAIIGLEVLGLAFAQVITYTLVLVVGLYLLFRDSRELLFESISLDFSKSEELLVFSSPLVLAGAMNMVMSQTDTILIGVLSTTSGVGIYNAVYPLAMLMFIVQSSIGFIFLPSFSQQDINGTVEETKEDYLFIVLLIIVLTFPVYFVFIYQPYITLETTFGSQYTGGSLALIILTTGFYLRAILGPNNQALKAIGNTKKIMYLDVVAALTNVVLNILLIPYYGFLGAAIATTIAYLLMGTLYSIFLFSSTGIHPISNTSVLAVVLSLVAPYFVRIIFNKTEVYNSILWTVIIATGSTLCYLFFLQTTGVFDIYDLVMDYMGNT
jgi:O-antigen/teichoic acid export membrane protein